MPESVKKKNSNEPTDFNWVEENRSWSKSGESEFKLEEEKKRCRRDVTSSDLNWAKGTGRREDSAASNYSWGKDNEGWSESEESCVSTDDINRWTAYEDKKFLKAKDSRSENRTQNWILEWKEFVYSSPGFAEHNEKCDIESETTACSNYRPTIPSKMDRWMDSLYKFRERGVIDDYELKSLEKYISQSNASHSEMSVLFNWLHLEGNYFPFHSDVQSTRESRARIMRSALSKVLQDLNIMNPGLVYSVIPNKSKKRPQIQYRRRR